MRQKFITKYTNICYEHHNIQINVLKTAKIIETVKKMNDNNEKDNYKIAGGRPPAMLSDWYTDFPPHSRGHSYMNIPLCFLDFLYIVYVC